MSDFSTGASLVVDVDEASLRRTRDVIERRVGSVSVGVDQPRGSYGGRQARDQAFSRRLQSKTIDTLQAVGDDVGESLTGLAENTDLNLDLNQERNDLLRQLLDTTEKGHLTRARGGGSGLGGFGMIGGLAIAGAGVGLANLITNIKPSEVISGTLDVADDLISSAVPASALVTGTVTAAELVSGTIGAGDLVHGIVDPNSFIGSAVSVGTLLTGASVAGLLTSVSVGSLLTSSSVGSLLTSVSVGSLLTSVSVGSLLTTTSVGGLLSSVAIGALVTTSSIGSLLTSVSVGSLLTSTDIGMLLTPVSVGGLLTAVSIGSLLTSISATDIITAVPLSKLVEKPSDGGSGSEGGGVDPKTIGLVGLLGAGGALLADTASGAASAAGRAAGSAGSGIGIPSLPVLFGDRSESGQSFVDGVFDDLLGDDDNRQRTSTQQAAVMTSRNTASVSGSLAAKQPGSVTVEHKPTYELREGAIRELGRQQQKDLDEFDRRLTELERVLQRRT